MVMSNVKGCGLANAYKLKSFHEVRRKQKMRGDSLSWKRSETLQERNHVGRLHSPFSFRKLSRLIHSGIFIYLCLDIPPYCASFELISESWTVKIFDFNVGCKIDSWYHSRDESLNFVDRCQGYWTHLAGTQVDKRNKKTKSWRRHKKLFQKGHWERKSIKIAKKSQKSEVSCYGTFQFLKLWKISSNFPLGGWKSDSICSRCSNCWGCHLIHGQIVRLNRDCSTWILAEHSDPGWLLRLSQMYVTFLTQIAPRIRAHDSRAEHQTPGKGFGKRSKAVLVALTVKLLHRHHFRLIQLLIFLSSPLKNHNLRNRVSGNELAVYHLEQEKSKKLRPPENRTLILVLPLPVICPPCLLLLKPHRPLLKKQWPPK